MYAQPDEPIPLEDTLSMVLTPVQFAIWLQSEYAWRPTWFPHIPEDQPEKWLMAYLAWAVPGFRGATHQLISPQVEIRTLRQMPIWQIWTANEWADLPRWACLFLDIHQTMVWPEEASAGLDLACYVVNRLMGITRQHLLA